MFQEKEVKKAVADAAYLLLGDDPEAETVADGFDYEAVVQSLWDRLETIYVFKGQGSYEKSFDYYGKELFQQKGVLLHSRFWRGADDIVIATYEEELWMLEDFSLVVVMCFFAGVLDEGKQLGYITEFRTFKGTVGRDVSYRMSVDDFETMFLELCASQYEMDAPYYEP